MPIACCPLSTLFHSHSHLVRSPVSAHQVLVEEGEENMDDSPLGVIEPQRQRELVAALYIARNDEHITVRQAASAGNHLIKHRVNPLV